MEKGFVKIDFTKGRNFKKFDKSLIKFLIRNKRSSIIHIIDNIYPLKNLKYKSYEIKDHINLSGSNPLKGPQFISLTNIYNTKKGIIVASLREGLHPNKKETKVLLKSGVQAYCYNIAEAAILATSLGLNIKATGIVRRL